MVIKMNTESTVTEVIPNQASQNATTITITLHPQPKNLDVACDSHSAVSGGTTLTNMSPASSADSLQQTQMMVKRSLKLDLKQNDDDNLETVKSFESISPNNEIDSSMKSPKSPMSPRNGNNFSMSNVNPNLIFNAFFC